MMIEMTFKLRVYVSYSRHKPITSRVTICLTGWDLTKQVKLLFS